MPSVFNSQKNPRPSRKRCGARQSCARSVLGRQEASVQPNANPSFTQGPQQAWVEPPTTPESHLPALPPKPDAQSAAGPPALPRSTGSPVPQAFLLRRSPAAREGLQGQKQALSKQPAVQLLTYNERNNRGFLYFTCNATSAASAPRRGDLQLP